MPIVALTGGVAAGKSVVTQVLESCGAVVVDADLLAREVVRVGSPALASIVQRFGEAVLDASGGLDRARLASVVFGDDTARVALEEIVHPLVKALSEERLQSVQSEKPGSVLIYAVPLLAEKRSPHDFDLVVTVDAPASVRAARLVEHRGFSVQDAQARIGAQATDEGRRDIADIILDSSVSESKTRELAALLFQVLDGCWPDQLDKAPGQYQALQS